jgi:hypothetical protein
MRNHYGEVIMRYFVAFIAMLGLLFLLLFLLLHGGGKPKVPTTHKTLISYAMTDAQARLTIDGPINADLNHRAIRIIVDQNQVSYEQIKGYQNTVINHQSFVNNQTAYVNFLAALQHAGFTVGVNDPALKDERGYCPTGDRYVFELKQDGHELERYWATSCGKPKTYKGALTPTLSLFQAQVPGYIRLSQGLGL